MGCRSVVVLTALLPGALLAAERGVVRYAASSEGIPWIEDFRDVQRPDVPPRVSVAWRTWHDGRHLRFEVKADEVPSSFDSHPPHGEMLEVNLDPSGTCSSFYKVVVGPLGDHVDYLARERVPGCGRYAFRKRDIADARIETCRTPSGWSATVAIPLSSLEGVRADPSAEWRMAVCRQHVTDEHGIEYAVSAPATGFNAVSEYPRFVLERADCLCLEKQSLGSCSDRMTRSVELRLTSPSYRDCIFETMGLSEIRGEVVVAPDGLGKPLDVRLEGCGVLKSHAVAAAGVTNAFAFSLKGMPKGDYRLTAGDAVRPVRNLSYRKGEVWFDRTGVCHRDGRRMMPFGWSSENYRYVHPGENFTQCYWGGAGTDLSVAEEVCERAARHGMSVMFHAFDTPPRDRFDDAMKAKLEKTVAGLSGNPAFFGYYLCEAPEALDVDPALLAEIRDFIAARDPYHPTLVAVYSEEGAEDYCSSADIVSVDVYPGFFRDGTVRNHERLAYDKMRAASAATSSWVTPQAFDWIVTLPGRPSSCHGTYDALRAQCLAGLAGDARGVMLFSRTSSITPSWHLRLGANRVLDELLEARDGFLAPSTVVYPEGDGVRSNVIAAFKRSADDTLFRLFVHDCGTSFAA